MAACMSFNFKNNDDIKQTGILLSEKKGFSDISIQNIVETLGLSGKVFFREMRHLCGDSAVEVKRKREKFRKELEPGILAFAI